MITVMCRLLEITRSGYYSWLGRGPSSRRKADVELSMKISRLYQQHNQRYGSPRIHRALRQMSIRCSRKRVARLMQEAHLRAKSPQRSGNRTDSAQGLEISENLLNRHFTAERPNQAWVSDMSYIRTEQGWLYLAVVLDLYARRVVGYCLSQQGNRHLVIAALKMAVSHRRINGVELIHHSDRGSPYCSAEYQHLLRLYGIRSSMSRRGNCHDNAVAESFFARMKTEVGHRFITMQAAREQLQQYLDIYYNHQRLHSANDYLTPAERERRYYHYDP